MNIPKSIIKVEKKSSIDSFSFKIIIPKTIAITGDNSCKTPAVIISILGITIYQITYPKADVTTPETIAKNSV